MMVSLSLSWWCKQDGMRGRGRRSCGVFTSGKYCSELAYVQSLRILGTVSCVFATQVDDYPLTINLIRFSKKLCQGFASFVHKLKPKLLSMKDVV